jgi:hypothetical protein
MSVADSAPLATVSRVRAISATAILSALALIKLVVQLAGIRNYGFFRDELYFLSCAQHLAWGYVDQPPFMVAVAWFARHLFGDSIVGLRIFPVLMGMAVVFFTGLLARELDGGSFAQFLAALTILCAPAYLAFDSYFSMNALEPLLWLVCAWLIVRIVKSTEAEPRLWLAFGLVAGIGLENKHSMLAFGFALVVGLLLNGHARILASRWAWIAAALAFVIFLPNLLWEAHHGWPQIEVVRNAQQFKNVVLSPARFMVEQILFLDPLALPVWFGGLIWLLISPEAKRFRFLGIAYLVVIAIVMGVHEKTYYPLPVYPLVVAAGGVAFERLFAPTWRWLRAVVPSLVVIGGLVGLPLAVPILPINALIRYSDGLPFARVQTERDSAAQLSQLFGDELPWQQITSHVAAVYHTLPADEQADCAIFGGNYGEASAIDYYGPALGLPKSIGGHNAYFYWGPRNYSGRCVIFFGERAQEYTQYFGEVHLADTIVNSDAMPAEQAVQVFVCRKPVAPLSVLWPHFKMII